MTETAEFRPPEEVFNGDHLPDDLKWIITHFGLPRNDPIVVLFAWHWQRVQQTTDVIQAASHQLRAMLDMRVEKTLLNTEHLNAIDANLQALAEILDRTPLGICEKIERELKTPIAEGVSSCAQLGETLGVLIHAAENALHRLNWRQLIACYAAGLATGSLFTLWLFSLLF